MARNKDERILNKIAQSQRVYIFDPCFGGLTGHWENYCKRLYKELIDHHYEVTVFGQKDFDLDIVGDLQFSPVFTADSFTPVRNLLDMKTLSDEFLNDFNKIDVRQFVDGDIFIFHSIYESLFNAIIEWTGRLVQDKKIACCFFFQFPPSSKKEESALYQKLRDRFSGLLSRQKKDSVKLDWIDNNNIRFYQRTNEALKHLTLKSHLLMASTEVLSRNFAALLNSKVRYLPMPGERLEVLTSISHQTNHRKEAGTITIGYFGHASLEKGGQFLYKIVVNMLSKFSYVKFIIHVNPNEACKESMALFETLNNDRVECHYGHLTQQAITDLVNRVDVLFMPYSPEKYATTPSAIFTEALPLKKVFVLPKSTWCYEEAMKVNAGISVFSTYNESSLIKALKKCILKYKKLKLKSMMAGEVFYRENNMGHYMDVFYQHLNEFGYVNQNDNQRKIA